ncbi:STICHEL [Olea europaea subsp. europaea]|uniref:STICHEL n=1 Tax=Olea europaea subsp. europaea TaxID=158383 RepID=A0A8S0SGJ1_OLEEU|nr:STICHEL [Olea europaea subsp. europaea]
MRGRGGMVAGGSGGGAIDPRNLHLKKELTQIRKAARVLRDPGTTSSWRSPHNSARSIAKNHHFHHHNNGGRHSIDDNVFRSSSQQLVQLPLQVEKGNNYSNSSNANNNANVNVVKKDRKVFLYNWRSQKSESESRQIGEDDVENAKDDGSSSTTEESADVDSSSDARNGGANDSKSDTCLSDRYASGIFKCKDTIFRPSTRRKNKKSKRSDYYSASLRHHNVNLKKQNISSRDAKYVVEGIADLGLGRDDLVSLMDQSDDTEDFPNSDDLRRESAILPLLARLQNKDCVRSPSKLLKSNRKENDSISSITPALSTSSFKFGDRNPSTIGSWDATTASFNNAEDEVEDHLDLSGILGCGIPCYWSKTSMLKFRGNGSGSPSLSDTLRRKGSSIFCGSQSLSQRRHHRSSLVSNKRRQSSRPAAKGVLPLLSADSQEGSSMGSEKSDNELTTTFGELDLEAMSRLDGRRWSTICRSQEGLARVGLNGEIIEENSPENIKSLSWKYRPMFFNELFGQKMVVQSLKSTISKGRIAPVYLFHGPRGTGKTSTARIFAAALNCLATEETKPCGFCRKCADFLSGKSKNHQEVDVSNKNGIDRVKNIFRNLAGVSSSTVAQYKVFVIDECHLLPSKTWLAFLRFLEKPLPHVMFILVTTDCNNIPRTILSRCHMHLFNKISNSDIIIRLRKIAADENLDVEANALDLIASNADGSLRDAETLLDQLSLLGKRVTTSLIGVVSDEKLLVLLELAMSSNTTEMVIRARELMDSGVDPIALMSQLAAIIVDIIAGTYPNIDAKLNSSFFGGRSLSERELDKLKHALMLLSEAKIHLRVSSEQSTWFTATLLQLGSVPSPDRTQSGSSRRQSFKTNGQHHIHTFREATAQKQRSDAANFNPSSSQSIDYEALTIRHNDFLSGKSKSRHMNTNTLIDIWAQCVEKCHSRTLRHLLHTYGKLVSISEVQGCFVVYIAFADSNIKTRAEGFLSSITNSFEIVLRRNVEVKIILLPDSFRQKQMDPIISMENENKSICSSAIEANLNLDSRQKPPKVSRGSFIESKGHQMEPSESGTGNDRVRRIESIIREQRLEAARLQAMEKGARASTNRLRPERNQVLPQDGSFHQNNMDSLTSIDLPLQHWEDELNREIKALKINEGTESQMDDVIKRISPYPISPSLLHNSRFATNFSRDNMGYESGLVGGGCSGLFCWNKSKTHRREKVKRYAPTHRCKSRRFSWFGECAKSRRTHSRYKI